MRVIMKKYTFEDILLNQINIPLSLIKNYKKASKMTKDLTMSEEKCADILKNLMQKNILTISEENNEYNKISESYSLNLLWEKLYNEINNEQKNDLEPDESGSIFILFEQE